MKESKKNDIKKQLINRREKMLTSIIIILLFIVIGLSFAFFTMVINGTRENKVEVGTMSLYLNDSFDEGILLENAVPVTDKEGLGYNPHKFTLTNNGTIRTSYTIYLDDLDINLNEDRLNDEYVKYELIKNGISTIGWINDLGENPNRILDFGYLNVDDINEYEFRIWLDIEAGNEAINKTFLTRLRVVGAQLPEDYTVE